jgi:hypothetical protein
MDEEIEIWLPIMSFDGCFISNLGRVKRIRILSHWPKKGHVTENILHCTINNWGYKMVNLSNHKLKKVLSVHRLVALNFIPIVTGKNYINHQDGNKLNNHYLNLEWCTPKENAIHSVKNGLQKYNRDNHKNRFRSIIDNSSGKIYESIADASRELGIRSSSICNYLKTQPLISIFNFSYVFDKPNEKIKKIPVWKKNLMLKKSNK